MREIGRPAFPAAGQGEDQEIEIGKAMDLEAQQGTELL